MPAARRRRLPLPSPPSRATRPRHQCHDPAGEATTRLGTGQTAVGRRAHDRLAASVPPPARPLRTPRRHPRSLPPDCRLPHLPEAPQRRGVILLGALRGPTGGGHGDRAQSPTRCFSPPESFSTGKPSRPARRHLAQRVAGTSSIQGKPGSGTTSEWRRKASWKTPSAQPRGWPREVGIGVDGDPPGTEPGGDWPAAPHAPRRSRKERERRAPASARAPPPRWSETTPHRPAPRPARRPRARPSPVPSARRRKAGRATRPRTSGAARGRRRARGRGRSSLASPPRPPRRDPEPLADAPTQVVNG